MFILKSICFDYYGTLVKLNNPFEKIKEWMEDYLYIRYPQIDSEKFHRTFIKYRAKITTDKIFLSGEQILSKSLQKTCNFFGISCFNNVFIPFVKDLFASPQAYSDAYMVVNELKKYFLVGLLTNADNPIINESIEKLKFKFDFTFTSESVGANKPDNLIFSYALEKLGVKAEDILMIGDSQNDDIYGAGQMNIKTIWVNRNGEMLKEGIKPPIAVVKRLEEIIPIICQ